jgi:pimeloyl-ACP methyl ester carboxylesterase
MRRHLAILFLAPLLMLGGDDSIPVKLRGNTQLLLRIAPVSGNAKAAVLFLPGDGGWRGAAVTMARRVASWSYDVYGFDTKKYLESCSQGGSLLRLDDMAADVRQIAARVAEITNRPVIVVGWSQGAAMAVAATSGERDHGSVRGVVTLGLPEHGVLGWDWKATVASLAGREPDQPTFAVKPLLQNAAHTRIWMIHGLDDEYTSAQICRELFQAASGPRQLHEVAGANHRFDGHIEELNRWLQEGLQWAVSN